MVYTLTLSPSLNKAIEVQEFAYDDVNTILSEKRSAQGKGIDVSRVIKELGGQSVALGLMGGYNGLEVEGRLAAEGILCDFTRVNGETRLSVSIHQQRKKMRTLLSAPAAKVSEFEVAVMYNKIRQIPKGSYVVMTGSPPPGIDEDFYAQIITILKSKGIKTFLDADGEVMKSGVRAGPYLVKPNVHEFGRLVESSLKDREEVAQAASAYLGLVDFVVVSMGAKGAIGVSQSERYFVSPPKVNVKSSIGAGDALLAGIVFGLSEGGSFKDALSLGVACGTASTLNAGPAVCTRDDVYTIMKQISVNGA
jgi:1-phosphofructokinase family hexose kinase